MLEEKRLLVVDVGHKSRDLDVEPENILPGSLYLEMLVHQDARGWFGPYLEADIQARI